MTSEQRKSKIIPMKMIIPLIFMLMFIADTQANFPSRCHPLATKYHLVASNWQWIDTDTVVFSVGNGGRLGDLVPPDTVWYQYHPSLDQLEELDEDQYRAILSRSDAVVRHIPNLQLEENDSYKKLAFSPTENVVIYPRFASERAESTYWLINIDTGLELNLEIPTFTETGQPVSLDVFWSGDERRFITQVEGLPNSFAPSRLVTLGDNQVDIQFLLEASPLTIYGTGFYESNFRIKGFSPDGNIVLIRPDVSEYVSWMVNLADQTIDEMNFSLYGDRVVWRDDQTFITITNLGVIQYNLQTNEMKIIVSKMEIDGAGESLSPDGRFFMSRYDVEREVSGSDQYLIVCQMMD
jgi:hypothetical protein